MKHFHFFDTQTGLFHGDALAVNSSDKRTGGPSDGLEMAQANCPEGHKPIEGHFDPLSQRVDVSTGAVVDYKPPQPSTDHEWNADAKRWQLKAEVVQRNAQRAAALAQIVALEAGQLRAVREALCGDVAAVQRLRTIDAAITKLRTEL